MGIGAIPTEQRNPNTVNIDEVSTLEMLQMINREDQKVAFCVEKSLDSVAAAVDAIAEKYALGGRIVYVGAGTSGRMGFMDASECPPTYGVSRDRVISLIAGGISAVSQAVEDAEDHKEFGVNDLKGIDFSKNDVLIGLAASGRTPYVIGATEYAKSIGALTVSVTCNESVESPINSLVDYPIGIYAGPEAITGSTRMKAGTVQKLVLNMISTGVMVKTGKVYSNYMVNVQIKNEKLAQRAKSIIAEITGAGENEIEAALESSGNDVSLSIFMLMTGTDKEKAEQYMQDAGGHIKHALALFNSLPQGERL